VDVTGRRAEALTLGTKRTAQRGTGKDRANYSPGVTIGSPGLLKRISA